MTTEHAAPEVAQDQAEAFALPDHVQEELTKLQEARERLETWLRDLKAQEADLSGQVSWNDAMSMNATRVRLAGPRQATDLDLVRSDVSAREGELESVDRRLTILYAYIGRLREQAAASVPPPMTERMRLQVELQAAIFDHAVSGRGQRRIEELERQLEDLDRQERRARLLEIERQRREQEAERQRREQEQAALRSQRAQVQAQLMAKQREYQDLLAVLIGVGEEIARLDSEQYNLGGRAEGWGTLHGQMGAARRRLESYTTARFSRAGLFKDAPPVHPADLEPLAPPATDEPDGDLPSAAA